MQPGWEANFVHACARNCAGFGDRGDFDLVAVGRALLSDPEWLQKIRDGRDSELKSFDRSQLATLV